MQSHKAHVTTDDHHLTLTAGARLLWSIAWAAVDRIQAFKLDLITADEVCLEFLTGETSYVVDEEVTGWNQLLETLSDRYRVAQEWAEIVIAQAFATNRTVLWDRDVAQAQDRLAILPIEQLWDRFRTDGASPDIVVTATAVQDWNDMIAIVRGTFGFVDVTCHGEFLAHGLTSRHFHGEHRAELRFRAGDIAVAGHCLQESQIELRIGPHDVHSSHDLAVLLRLIVVMAVFLRKPVAIAMDRVALFEASPSGDVHSIGSAMNR